MQRSYGTVRAAITSNSLSICSIVQWRWFRMGSWSSSPMVFVSLDITQMRYWLNQWALQKHTDTIRLQNSPHFCVFKYARAVKQKVWNEAETESETGVRLARFARVRLLRYALPISLLILRKEPTVLQSTTRLINRPLMDLHTNDRQKHFGGQTDVKLELNSLSHISQVTGQSRRSSHCLLDGILF